MGKAKAMQSFFKVIKQTDFEVVLKGAQRYKSDPNREQAYTLYPATWLNGQRWLDEALPAKLSTAENQKQKELQEAKAKAERKRAEDEAWFKEQELQRERAVPPPAELREFLKKSFTI